MQPEDENPPLVTVIPEEIFPDESLKADANERLDKFDTVIFAFGLTMLKSTVASTPLLPVPASDLVPGQYEGGFKLWEGTIDLVNAVQEEVQQGRVSLQGKHVLELGCGHGLPGIYACLQGAASVHFQDFNRDVLQRLTTPNVAANLANSPGGDGESATDAVTGNRTRAEAGNRVGLGRTGSKAGQEDGQGSGPITHQAKRMKQRQETGEQGGERGKDKSSNDGERERGSAEGGENGHVKGGRSSIEVDAERDEQNGAGDHLGVKEGEEVVDDGCHVSGRCGSGGSMSGTDQHVSHAAVTATRFFAGDWKDLAPLLCGAVEADRRAAKDSAMNSHCCSEADQPQPRRPVEQEGEWVEGSAVLGEDVGKYDIILTAETVYSPESVKSLLSLVHKCLRPKDGVLYLAAKKHYFGVGGGSRFFKQQAAMLTGGKHSLKGTMLCSIADGSSNLREVWKFTLS